MHVAFGASVFGSDGKRLGEVDGLVVDAGTKRANAILVDAGLLDRGKRMIEVSALQGSDQDGLHLEESRAAANAEAERLDSEEVSFAQRVEPPTTFIPAVGVGGPIFADAPPAPGQYPDEGSFFDIAPLDPPPVEVESNLEENDVVLGRGTRVVSRDDHELGTAIAFDLGDMGRVDAVTVAEGLIFRTNAAIALSDIDEFGTDAIHLRLTRAEAEAR